MNSLSETEVARLRQLAHKLIPAGAHTYSRADDQFPANAPSFVQRAEGCYFWDEQGRKFLDYGMGLLSVSLGHAHETVNAAVSAALTHGTCYSRPSLMEAELADILHAIIPCAEMLKFSKNGSDVTAAAIRLARHYTRRDLVVRCRQHPFHSVADWFIGSTSRPGGVPETIRQQVLHFDYNDIKSLQSLFDTHPGRIACVIMEPMTSAFPAPGFLQAVKDCCKAAGAVLIFDEILTGFRIHIAGGQGLFGVIPDLATFGKGIANGFPLAVLSGTYGGETIGLAAALATIRFQLEHNVPEHLANFGELLMKSFQSTIDKYALADQISVSGHPARPDLRFSEQGKTSYRLKTLFMQEMLKEGILMERIGICHAHGAAELERTTAAISNTCSKIAKAIAGNKVDDLVEGPVVKPVFTF